MRSLRYDILKFPNLWHRYGTLSLCMSKFLEAHYNQEVSFCSAVMCKKGPNFAA